MATITLNKENFEETVNGNDVVIIDFWASWCGPCKAFAPIFEKVSERYPKIVFGKVETDDQQELAQAFQIRSIPTLMIFREKIIIFSQPGMLPEPQFVELIEKAMMLDMDQVRKEISEKN
ncbi:MAG: thioredoxin [Magnetococcales bacterium]|nr:thioredoxin [Magnetococcales bacterium]MBF0172451.1 thioredoxin [Magnetococcales bacterium]MBF0347734.1 thioredoxin [Magnetococcales bacterium]MBF0631373.1 thioredoxin [Magnetococcales bacterium]